MSRAPAWQAHAAAMTSEPSGRSGLRPETAHRPRTGSGKFRLRSKPDGSWQIDPLVQHAQNSRRGTPDISLGKRHRVIRTLDAAKFLAVKLVVRRIHQERQRHF